jgi:hypothetical protein
MLKNYDIISSLNIKEIEDTYKETFKLYYDNKVIIKRIKSDSDFYLHKSEPNIFDSVLLVKINYEFYTGNAMLSLINLLNPLIRVIVNREKYNVEFSEEELIFVSECLMWKLIYPNDSLNNTRLYAAKVGLEKIDETKCFDYIERLEKTDFIIIFGKFIKDTIVLQKNE